MTTLIEQKTPRPRFARSINVERDSGSIAVDSYLPVGRAVDAIGRLATALERSDVEVAISITGPYGSGKSSLAVVLDALFGPSKDRARCSAEELLAHTAPDALARLNSARARLGAEKLGFIRAVVTAQRESITTTALRALRHGVQRYQPASRDKVALAQVARKLAALARDDAAQDRPRPHARSIRAVVSELGNIAPVFLLIDEFGKNLEAFADTHSDADLFLLQELAEWTRGGDGLRLAVVTLQHLAFDEYASGATTTQRREWAKIQGRFEDIPFIDTAAQTRALVAAAFEPCGPPLAIAQSKWASEQVATLSALGLTDLAGNPALLAECWPLHPVALVALPELCERYGQNERTLFSFLAGSEPRSVASFLREREWAAGAELPVVRLDRLYDYFIEAAANLVAISSNASRWLEIDTRVRDAVGLSPAARRVLKAVGLLNLVSAGGLLRASKALLTYAVVDGQPGTRSAKDVASRLRELEAAGLVTFRDFADEYRVWHGSDFDLRSAVDVARRRLRDAPASELLNRVFKLGPIVAARHSHTTGTLRAFERSWVADDVDVVEPLGPTDRGDGLALYVLGSSAPTGALARRVNEKPVVFVTAPDAGHLSDAAREVAALDEILATAGELTDDWVARKELLERRVEALADLDRTFHTTFGSSGASWTTTKPARRRWTTRSTPSGSGVISEVCDAWYPSAPIIRNDLINRHELSSQAAKARRMLLEAMSGAPEKESLGIEGFGPDRTLYLSVLQAHGLHRQDSEGSWIFSEPYERGELASLWARLNGVIADAKHERLRLDDIYEELSAPPFGLRAGVAPIVVVTALIVGREEVALYEHGTFRPALTDDVLERLLRNPGNFEVKHYATRSGPRAELLTLLADSLSIGAARGRRSGRVGSVLAVVSHLVALVNGLPDHVKKTRHLSEDTLRVRRALLTATEPDELLFREIPESLGLGAVQATSAYPTETMSEIAARLQLVCVELRTAYERLLREIEDALRVHVGPTWSPLREGLAARARELDGKIIDRHVAKLAVALAADIPDLDAWLAYVALNVSGVAPEGWTDVDRERFFVSIHDTGGTFRRLHALNADLDAWGDEFDAYRSVLTRGDGNEVVHVIAIDDTIRSAGAPIIEQAATDLASQLGISIDEASALIVGLIGEAGLAEIRSPSMDVDVQGAYGDNVTRADA